MTSKAMVVVGGGSSSRFGGDKLMAVVAGEPVIAHAVRAASAGVDEIVLVCRHDQLSSPVVKELDVTAVAGGATRTRSEIAGLRALGGRHDLIGIHDAARPLVDRGLVETLFVQAERAGGAIPVVEPAATTVDRATLAPVRGLLAAQTPQVFRSAELRAAYRQAENDHFEGFDTAEVVEHYAHLDIVAVPGDPDNIKITYPADIELVRDLLEGS